MPQNWPQWYTTSGTTTNYIPVNTQYYTTAASTQTIWQNWNVTTTGSYQVPITYSDQAWIQWNQTWHQINYQPHVYTLEELAQMEAQQARQRAIYEERNQRRIAARTRARTLLEDFLDDEQKAELDRHGRFHVVGSKGRRYCIRAEGQSGNVDLLKPDGSFQARLCAHPTGVRLDDSPGYEALPEGDAWLMQMIEIRHDEDHFLRTVNVHRGALPALV